MNKWSALILLACASALLPAERVAAGPITWDFIATSCTSASVGPTGCDPATQYPLVLATLTLSGPDSSGSAMAVTASGTATLIGDPFAFDLVAALSSQPSAVSTAEPLGPPPVFPGGERWVVAYEIAWTETAGALTSVGIDFVTFQDSVGPGFGLTGGEVGSDFRLAGCVFAQCTLSGYWVNASLLTAPEPDSLALLASAFGLWGLIRRRRVLDAN